MNIEIRTRDGSLLSEIFGKPDPSIGNKVNIADGVIVTYQGLHREHGMMGPSWDTIYMAANIPTAIAAGVFANWLWAKLRKRKNESVKLDRTIIQLSRKGEFLQIFRETIEQNAKRIDGPDKNEKAVKIRPRRRRG